MLLPQLSIVDASLAPVSPEERDRDDQAVMATLLTRFVVEAANTADPAPSNGRLTRSSSNAKKRGA